MQVSDAAEVTHKRNTTRSVRSYYIHEPTYAHCSEFFWIFTSKKRTRLDARQNGLAKLRSKRTQKQWTQRSEQSSGQYAAFEEEEEESKCLHYYYRLCHVATTH